MEANPRTMFVDPPNMVTRSQWGAQDVDQEHVLPVPVTHVMLTYTGGLECHNPQECVPTLRTLQKRDIHQRGMRDIQHNFYIGSDGLVYEGRGFHFKASKEPRNLYLDNKSVDIAFIGDFTAKDPSDKMLSAAGELTQYMLKYKIVSLEFTVVPLGLTNDRTIDNTPEDGLAGEDRVVYYDVTVPEEVVRAAEREAKSAAQSSANADTPE